MVNSKKSKLLLIFSIFSLLLTLTLVSCISLKENTTAVKKTNEDLITIQGKVTIQGSNSAPLGLTTVNVANRWMWKDDSLEAYGENERVFVNRKGYYKITIQKGDTLVFIPNQIIYGRNIQQYTYTNLKESQTLNITIKEDKQEYQKITKDNPKLLANLTKHINEVNPDKLVSVSGTIRSKDSKKPLKNVSVSSSFNNNTEGTGTYHLTNQNGEFYFKIPQKNMCSVLSLSANAIRFYPKNDTIINLYL